MRADHIKLKLIVRLIATVFLNFGDDVHNGMHYSNFMNRPPLRRPDIPGHWHWQKNPHRTTAAERVSDIIPRSIQYPLRRHTRTPSIYFELTPRRLRSIQTALESFSAYSNGLIRIDLEPLNPPIKSVSTWMPCLIDPSGKWDSESE